MMELLSSMSWRVTQFVDKLEAYPTLIGHFVERYWVERPAAGAE